MTPRFAYAKLPRRKVHAPYWPIWLLLGTMLLWTAQAMSQARVPIPFNQGIPEQGFKSWSLFLVCDPAWLHPEKQTALLDLRQRYWFFGDTTGSGHAAVWFTREVDPDSELDTDRMRKYCERFQLVPSAGPHIVVTTIPPDRWAAGDSKVQLALKGSAADAQRKLTKLNDLIAQEKLSQQQMDSELWWAGLLRGLESACQWLDKVEWAVDVRALSIKRTGVCT